MSQQQKAQLVGALVIVACRTILVTANSSSLAHIHNVYVCIRAVGYNCTHELKERDRQCRQSASYFFAVI